jgi:hypothetical protein
MANTKSRRNIRSKRNLSKKNKSRKNRNSRRMKGGNFLGIIPNMGIKSALGLDCESRLKSQKCAFQNAYAQKQVGAPSPVGYKLIDCQGNVTEANFQNTKDAKC